MGQAKKRGSFEERLLKAPKIKMSEREIYNSAPNMIHENKYEVTDCYLCGEEMFSIHDTHNAFPLAKLQSAKEAYESGENYRCCSKCNVKVFEERLNLHGVKIEDLKVVSMVELIQQRKTTGESKSMFTTPQSTKRFEELGQNFYETELGKSYLKDGVN